MNDHPALPDLSTQKAREEFKAYVDRVLTQEEATETFQKLRDSTMTKTRELGKFLDETRFEDWSQGRKDELKVSVMRLAAELAYMGVLLAAHAGEVRTHERLTNGERCQTCEQEVEEMVKRKVAAERDGAEAADAEETGAESKVIVDSGRDWASFYAHIEQAIELSKQSQATDAVEEPKEAAQNSAAPLTENAAPDGTEKATSPVAPATSDSPSPSVHSSRQAKLAALKEKFGRVVSTLQRINQYLDDNPCDTLPEEEQENIRSGMEVIFEEMEYMRVFFELHARAHGDRSMVDGRCSACREEARRRLEAKAEAKEAAKAQSEDEA
ncbi:hypothetical protein LTR36_000829 [Oleoguttula mirabilis]|uniref:Uncharacterized protein n=1 Tax=Oleoguttula mirabilis TaxID=1507867 RepID=A0AAV9J3L6_9PEZI|nr:hypothetical protein LTR36_000829 [Oleoguttula mirabilis]